MSAAPPPSDAVRKALGLAAMDNAERLIRDASLLLASGSVPTAHSVAVLGLEEVGKAIGCAPIDVEGERAQTRKEFLDCLRSHTAKLEQLHQFVEMLNTLIDLLGNQGHVNATADDTAYQLQLRTVARSNHVRKMRGFYVDLSEHDEIETPSDVTEMEAREVLELATAIAESARSTFFADE